MAEQAEADDVFEEDIDILDQGGDADDQGDEDQHEDEGANDEDEEADEVLVTFEGEAAPASEGKSEPDLLRTLRAANRQLAKEVATLKRSAPQPKPVVIEVGPKPTLESCDFEDEKFVAETEAWIERKRQAAEAEAQAAKGTQALQEEFDGDLARFQTARAGLSKVGVRDFDEAKDAVAAALSQVQIIAILQASEDSAKVIYALGKHPAKLEAIKAITNPNKLSAAVAKLEGTLKVTKTSRKAPELDTPVRGSAPLSASKDKHLAKLEAEAERTNDRSKVIAYKREQRTSQAK